MSEEKITKQDILNVTGSMFDTMLDFVDNSHKEIESLQQENQQLKQLNKDKDIRNSKQRVANKKLMEKNQQLKQQLKQRDEVIEEAIKYIKSNEHYENYKIGAVVTGPMPLLEILTKHKGDSNEIK